jgi:ssDNA-binding Zn-finger/Zn-ribbon topoisomerase 1
MKCPNCNYILQNNEEICPACGYDLTPPKQFFNTRRRIHTTIKKNDFFAPEDKK